MRILFVNNIPFNPIYGGIERVTDILAKALKEHGHEVFYLCFYLGEQQREMLEYDFPAMLYIYYLIRVAFRLRKILIISKTYCIS